MVRVVDEVGRFRVFAADGPFDDVLWSTVAVPLGGGDALNGPFGSDGGRLTIQSLWLESEPVTSVESFRTRCRELTDRKTPRILAKVRRGRVLAFHVLKPSYKKEEDVPSSPAGGGSTNGGTP